MPDRGRGGGWWGEKWMRDVGSEPSEMVTAGGGHEGCPIEGKVVAESGARF